MIYSTVDEQDRAPFEAGKLDPARILATLKARAPSIHFDLPPMPLSLADVSEDCDLVSEYGLRAEPRTRFTRVSQDAALEELMPEWEKIVACGAVTRTDTIRHWSPTFTIHQTDKNRLIFDLRVFNATCSDGGFHMETIFDLPGLASGKRFACKLDLRSAFWQYPISDDLSQLFGTSDPRDPSKLFVWEVLPMGFSLSPVTFCSITSAFVSAWRAVGICVMGYVDDFIILANSPEELAQSTRIVVSDLIGAGVRISAKKSFIAPFNLLDFLGLAVDLTEQAFVITDDRLAKISEQARLLLVRGPQARHEVESFVGRVAFASVASPWLQYFRAAIIDDALSSHVTAWSTEAMEELSWWRDEAPAFLSHRLWPWAKLASTKLFSKHMPGRPLPDYEGATDASDNGIGMRFGTGPITSEPLPPWLPPTSPSTARELYGICRLVERYFVPPGSILRLACDNQGAVATAMGSSVCRSTAAVARRFFRVLVERDVIVEVEWMPRELLGDVDGASRWDAVNLCHSTLPHAVRQAICDRAYGRGMEPDVIFFSSPHNRWVPEARFGSRVLEPGSIGDGVGTSGWESCLRGWAYPPFSLVRPLLRRIASMSSPPHAVVVIPDSLYARAVLRGWESMPVPALLRPPYFTEEYESGSSLRAFISPALTELAELFP